MRPLRYIPPGGALVEVTCRTLQGRLLLRPSKRLNEIVVGVLARAKQRYEPAICAAVSLSNHYHLLLHVHDAKQLADFMRYVNSKLAREIARFTGWRHKIWARRYRAIVVSDEPAAQTARLRYILAHGVKENLVARATDWPGVHCAEALINDRSLAGWWFDRSEEWSAKNRGEDFSTYTHADPEILAFEPLPCWQNLDPARRRTMVGDLVREIEGDAADERQRRGVTPMGVDAILRQIPTEQPRRSKRSSAPDVHAATEKVRETMRQAYASIVTAFREASARLRQGERRVAFSEGTFPPALPFVNAASLPQPP